MGTPHVLVVGGGITGTGIARDLALRGIEVTLLERGRLADGATGRMHGLLHSGARYADTDPESAAACLAENRVLREIAPHCIEETGGLVVEHPEDPAGYFTQKRCACEDCGIPVEVTETPRDAEPALAPEIGRALRVPDATVDPFGLTAANAAAAIERGATVQTRTAVQRLVTAGGRVTGLELAGGETVSADHVVNAAGAWAGRLAASVGVDVPLKLSKGAMAVVADRPTTAVVNRCRPRGEADIVVPRGRRCILGTTDRAVEGPDRFERDRAEVDGLVDGLSAVVPSLAGAEVCRPYWGVRPLYDPEGTDETTEVTRGFAVLDHDLGGVTTVLGGKLTTYRRVAEAAADRVAPAVGVERPCRTADRPLPGADGRDPLAELAEQFGERSLTGE
jgi:glycerol-3-phosphate dehydrogenase